MSSICTRCDRRANATAESCMYCGGDVAHGDASAATGVPPRIAQPSAKIAPAVDPGRVSAASRPAVPPVQALPASRAIRVGDAAASATVVTPPVARAQEATAVAPPPPVAAPRSSAADATLPFPDAGSAERPMNGSRSAQAPVVVEAPIDVELPPLWQQILMIPFATRERAILSCGVAFVLAGVFAVNGLIESNKPPETGGGFILDTSQGKPVALPPDMPYPAQSQVVTPSEVRARKRNAAYQALREVGEVMEAYARHHTAYPPELSGDLRQIASFGDVAGPLSKFEGGEITRYERRLAADFRTDRATLHAIPAGLDEPIEYDIVFRRPKSSWPQ